MSEVIDLSAFDHPLVRNAGLRLRSSDPRRGELMKQLDQPAKGLRFPLLRLPDFKGSAEVEDGGLVRVFTEEERAELIYVFTRPIEECLEAFAGGRASFRAASEAAVGQMLPEILIEELFLAVLEALDRRREKPEILPT